MNRRSFFRHLALFAACAATPLSAQRPDTRTVEGVVRDTDGTPVKGAVVKIKNTKSLQIRSFFTNEEGEYRFHGLEQDTDFLLKAEYKGRSSEEKRVSSFNDSRKIEVNLVLK